MKTTMKLAMGIAFGMFMLVAMPSLASAQEDVSQKTIPSLELEQADVREALRALFKNVNVSYSIAPEVQGTVTVSLKSVTFETALQHVLRQLRLGRGAPRALHCHRQRPHQQRFGKAQVHDRHQDEQHAHRNHAAHARQLELQHRTEHSGKTKRDQADRISTVPIHQAP